MRSFILLAVLVISVSGNFLSKAYSPSFSFNCTTTPTHNTQGTAPLLHVDSANVNPGVYLVVLNDGLKISESMRMNMICKT